MKKQSFETHSKESRHESLNRGFRFKEIAEIEPGTTSIIEQLKDKIDKGEYDTLLSDDVGGRIPTLVLRKILKTRRPDKKLETFFIASGQTYIPRKSEQEEDYEELQDHLKKIAKKSTHALLVTQFIHAGSTIMNLSRALKDAGLKNFDVAAVDIAFEDEARKKIEPGLGENKLYTGGQYHGAIHEKHEHLSGVRKVGKGKYSPYPHKAVNVISDEGRELSMDEWREFFGVRLDELYSEWKEKVNDPERIKKYERQKYAEMTPEEKAEIQRNVNLAREDVNLLAERVIEKVWGK